MAKTYKTKIKLAPTIKTTAKVVLKVVGGTGPGVSFSGVRDSIISGNTTTLIDVILWVLF